MPHNKNQLLIFAKSPIAGKCKTRLIPFLSAEQACDVYKELITHCLNNLKSLNNIDINIYCHPDTTHPFLQNLSQTYTATLVKQQGDNLGQRMFNAIKTSLKTYDKCVLIGTDCPTLDSTYINNAFTQLNSANLVLGPAEDGGYGLIGANKIEASLFENIIWGTASVLKQSLKNIKMAKYTHHLLPSCWDIDTPDDFKRYQTYKETHNG